MTALCAKRTSPTRHDALPAKPQSEALDYLQLQRCRRALGVAAPSGGAKTYLIYCAGAETFLDLRRDLN
jgi:hypothetical protein